MSPRSGGEADKFGNRYEGVWTVHQLLHVLAGHVQAVTLEPLGEPGEGAEFTLERRRATEAHQVKRQRGSANEWSLPSLHASKVLESARRHVAGGREFHFVSLIPAWLLESLGDRARRSPYLASFIEHMLTNDDLRGGFDYLSGDKVYGSAESAWQTLRGTWAHWPDERGLRDQNAVLAALLLDGAPGVLAAAGLGELVQNNLAVRIDAGTLERLLSEYGLKRAQLIGSATIAQQVTSLSNSWKASVDLELLSPAIPRAEASRVADQLADEVRVLFMLGTAGGGKSAVLRQAVHTVEASGWPVLAMRLDRLGPFASTVDLGQNLGLTVSPVTALAAIGQDTPSLLVIDQLDAVSLASGRMPENFDAVATLLREAEAFPEMRVLIACRQFDVDNDHRIRALANAPSMSKVEVPPLNDVQVDAAVQALGLTSTALSSRQRALLRLPLNLVLLGSIADQDDALSFSTMRDLFDAYWDRKLRECRRRRQPPPRFGDVVRVLADAMSSQQRLAVPASVLDVDDLLDDADILASEHVLVRDGQQFAFFHESFFDYAFARQWLGRNETLVEFLLAGEQELFRRGQVRQILVHLREDHPERFVEEAEALLYNRDVRFHIKHVALAFLRALQAPTAAEWRMVERVLARDLPFAEQTWLALRAVPWFDRLDEDGVLDTWLRSGDEQLQNRAINVMIGGARERPDRMAALLARHAGQTERYPAWLWWVTRFADVHQSRALFELMLAATIRGEYDGREQELFMPVHNLGKQQPEWGVELLFAYLVSRPSALALDSYGGVAALALREYGAIELTTSSTAGAPASFIKAFVPYMLSVLALTERERDGRIFDRHFLDVGREPPYHEMEDALVAAAVGALQKYLEQQPDDAKPLLEQLAADRHHAAQWLLYEGLAVAGEAYTDYAAGLLLDREGGLQAAESPTVRRLIQAINPHLNDELFTRLEQAVLEFRPSWDGRPPGRPSFYLLPAMDQSRLSDRGRRRLGELQRLFNAEQPSEPERVSGGAIGSPIPAESAQRMTDDQWLRAMAKHNSDRENWTTFQGGAEELSQVLKEQVKHEPGRFCRLALRVGRDTNVSYTRAILMGLGETDVSVDPDLVFQAVRHIASLDKDANDRWLGWGLRKHLKAEIPDDIIHTLIDRSIHSPDPPGGTFSGESGDDESHDRDRLLEEGINTARGHCVEMLGDILVHDADGHRTSLVIPELNQIAADPSIAVRSCAAHLIAACLRHARPEAVQAFHLLIQTDDRLLSSHYVERLVLYIGNADVEAIKPAVHRMLSSSNNSVQRTGGRLAAYFGLERGEDELLSTARTSSDPAVRAGAAAMCAARLPRTANAAAAGEAVRQFANDQDEEVQKAVAEVASALRDSPLRPFQQELAALIGSPSFPHAVTQLLFTLEHAPDRVDELILSCARRFREFYGTDASDISTHAAADARHVGELLLRAYAQAADASARGAVLDLLDLLLASGAFGVPELVDATDR